MSNINRETVEQAYFEHLSRENEDKTDYLIAMLSQNMRIIFREEIELFFKRFSTTGEINLKLDKENLQKQIVDAFDDL